MVSSVSIWRVFLVPLALCGLISGCARTGFNEEDAGTSDADGTVLDADGGFDGGDAGGDLGGDQGPQSVFSEVPLLPGGLLSDLVQAPSNPDSMYLRASPGRVFVSRNRGVTWEECARPGFAGRELMVSIEDDMSVYLATSQDILRSTDGCQSWGSMDVGPDAYKMLMLDRDNILVGGSSGLWRITGGQVQPAPSPHDGFEIRSLLRQGSEGPLWAGAWGNGLARSDDGGQTWTLVNNPTFGNQTEDLEVRCLTVDRGNPDRVFVGSSGGLHKTTDGGATWDIVVANMRVDSVVANGGTIMYARDWGELYSSTNWGGSFSLVDSREWYMALAMSRELVMDLENSDRIYSPTYRGLFVTIDAGEIWSGLNNGIDAWTITDLTLQPDDNILYLATSSGVLRSEDDGASWALGYRGYVTHSYTAAVDTRSGGMVDVFSCAQRLYRSGDKGQNFSVVAEAGADDLWSFRRLKVAGNYWYAGSRARLWISEDSATNWTPTQIMGADRQVNDLLVLSGNRSLLVATPDGVFRSSNAGASFSAFQDGLGTMAVNCLAALPDGGFLAGKPDGIFQAAGLGTYWEPRGMLDREIVDLLVADPVVVAVTDAGVFYAALSDLTSWSELPGLADKWPRKLGLAANGDLLVGTSSFGLQRTPMPQP